MVSNTGKCSSIIPLCSRLLLYFSLWLYPVIYAPYSFCFFIQCEETLWSISAQLRKTKDRVKMRNDNSHPSQLGAFVCLRCWCRISINQNEANLKSFCVFWKCNWNFFSCFYENCFCEFRCKTMKFQGFKTMWTRLIGDPLVKVPKRACNFTRFTFNWKTCSDKKKRKKKRKFSRFKNNFIFIPFSSSWRFCVEFLSTDVSISMFLVCLFVLHDEARAQEARSTFRHLFPSATC